MLVQGPGTLQAGDCVRLLSRPHPSWTLHRIASLLYGNKMAQMEYLHRGVKREEWMGTMEELVEVCDQATRLFVCFLMKFRVCPVQSQASELTELAVCEYREELTNMLGKTGIGKYAERRDVTRTILCSTVSGIIVVVGLAILSRFRHG